MNELFLKRLSTYFPGEEEKFLDKLKENNKSALFLNTLKAEKESILHMLDFDYEASFLDNSYFHNCDHIGKTLAYDLGLIYPQDVESAYPSNLVNGDMNIICDLCAAPGGKSINIINRYPDSLLISNDVSLKRAQILSSNLERLGIDSIVCSKKVEDLKKDLGYSCDLVILDAPCSGEGMIRKYPEILDSYNEENIYDLAKIQSQLLEEAYLLCKDGGYILYSTCTYALEEDEKQIIDFLDKHQDIRLIHNDIDGNRSLFKGCIKLSLLNDTEGQFMALLRKDNADHQNRIKYKKAVKNKMVEEFINEQLNINEYYLYENNDYYYMSLKPLIDLGYGVLRYGICVGNIVNKRFEPHHHFYRANILKDKYKKIIELNDEELNKYLSGLQIDIKGDDGYYLICYKGYSLGFGKLAKGSLKNKYPKGLRRMI